MSSDPRDTGPPSDEGDSTRRLEGTGRADATESLPPADRPRVYRYEHDPELDATVAQAEDSSADVEEGEPPAGRSRGRQVVAGILGVLIGVIVALVLVALTTEPSGVDAGELEAAEERIEALERQVEELEAQLAEAEAAAGERDEDIEAQRDALDERAEALDQRAEALDSREAALQERAGSLDELERELAARQERLEEAERETEDDDLLPDDLPEIDDETADTIVDRVLEGIRDLFDGE